MSLRRRSLDRVRIPRIMVESFLLVAKARSQAADGADFQLFASGSKKQTSREVARK
jgi:hypothetical protein